MLKAAELDDHEMVPEDCVADTKLKPIGSGHGGISLMVTSSMYT